MGQVCSDLGCVNVVRSSVCACASARVYNACVWAVCACLVYVGVGGVVCACIVGERCGWVCMRVYVLGKYKQARLCTAHGQKKGGSILVNSLLYSFEVVSASADTCCIQDNTPGSH